MKPSIDFSYTCKDCCFFSEDRNICKCPCSEKYNSKLSMQDKKTKCKDWVSVYADFDFDFD